MISLTCIHCKATLAMDDAFAGGTCRCKHCGTIQTVPAKRAASPVSAGPKALYGDTRRPAGSGLDQLAEVVASSGLAEQAASSNKSRRGEKKSAAAGGRSNGPAPKTSSTRSMIAVGAIAGALSAAVVLFFVLRSPNNPPAEQATLAGGARQADLRPNDAGGVATPSNAVNAPATAAFCGVPLEGDSVIFVLDRGSSARESLGFTIRAALEAAKSMGRNKKYQIIFWDNGQDALAYPPTGPNYATPESLAAAARAIEATPAFGRSEAKEALRRAAAANPSAIVLVTAKAWELDDAFVEQVLLARGASSAKIHAISIGNEAASDTLTRIASSTGGTFAAVSSGDLRAFARGDE